jgi:hypothetical protein
LLQFGLACDLFVTKIGLGHWVLLTYRQRFLHMRCIGSVRGSIKYSTNAEGLITDVKNSWRFILRFCIFLGVSAMRYLTLTLQTLAFKYCISHCVRVGLILWYCFARCLWSALYMNVSLFWDVSQFKVLKVAKNLKRSLLPSSLC